MKYRNAMVVLLMGLATTMCLCADPIISEFSATGTDLADADGSNPDWIEIYNPDNTAVDLAGWHLSDDSSNLSKWTFPSTNLPAKGYLIVFASGKNRATAGQELHTNFSLSKSGEYLALVKPDGVTKSTEFAPYPKQNAALVYGLASNTVQLVDETTPMRFTTVVPASGWETSAFDHSSWKGSVSSDVGVVITEVDTGSSDQIEIQNLSATAVNTTGWKLLMGTDTNINTTLGFLINLPASMAPNQLLSFTENQGGVGNIPWTNNTSRGWVMLLNASNQVVDCLFWGSHTAAAIQGLSINTTIASETITVNGSDLPWVGGSLTGGNSTNNNARRGGDRDLDRAADFTFENGNGVGTTNTQLSIPFSSFGIVQARSGIGYDDGGGYDNVIRTFTASGTTDVYLRLIFNVTDTSAIDNLVLRTRYDDGFQAYLNGTPVDDINYPSPPGIESTVFREVDLNAHLNKLVNGQNVLAFHLKNSSSTSSDLLLLPELIATTNEVDYTYYQNATPGTANSGASFDGFLADTSFTVGRGFFSTGFNETITCEEPGATIIYTTDGSAPTLSNGTQVPAVDANTVPTANVSISVTTVLRAIAHKANFMPTNVDTNTYFFLGDVVLQSPTGTPPSGWPVGPVNGQVFDYGMDPDIVNSGTWGPQLSGALQQIPSISLVTDIGNLVDSANGIYVNAQNRGRNWERPTSVELIDPNGNESGFQVDAGIRIRGGFSRTDSNPKHSFRLFFRQEYGDSKLNYALFGNEGVEQFDAIDLRTAQNYAWSLQSSNDETRNSFLRDVFSRDLQREQQRPYTRSRYYHLYINGQYWGLYQTEERPEADYAESYFGGDDVDYDVVKASGANIEATDGNLDAWNTLVTLANAGLSSNSDYFSIQGKNADGTNNPSLDVHVDADNLIDFMLNVFYTGNADMPTTLGNNAPNNFWSIRDRTSRDGWRWIAHDNEHNMLSVNHNETSPTSAGTSSGSFNPKFLHQKMAENAEYRLRFADRVQKQLFNNGPMTIGNAQALLDSRSVQFDQAIIAESARWGDEHNATPLTKTTWLAEVDWLRNTFLSQRHAVVLGQLRSANLYPPHDAAVFSQHGGSIVAGFNLSITNPNASGSIYYTTDGSDPRLIGGGISGTAVNGTSVVLNASTTVKARILDGGTWSALTEADFITGVAPSASGLVISEFAYRPASPSVAEVGAGFDDRDDFEFIEIMNISASAIDLTQLEFINDTVEGGIGFDFASITNPADRLIAAGARILLVRNPAAFQMRYGSGLPVRGEYSGGLSNDGETIHLQTKSGTTIRKFTYNDQLPWPVCADGDGYSLVLIDPASAPDHTDPFSWRCSVQTNGSPGSSDALAAFSGDPHVDGDDDGLTALLEHALGSSDADSTEGIQHFSTSVVQDSGKDYMALSFRRRLGADDLDYLVEVSSDLINWQSGSGQVVLHSQVHNGDGTVTETWRMLSEYATGSRQFMRLKVSR